MKPDANIARKLREFLRLACFPVFLFFCSNTYSQISGRQDSLKMDRVTITPVSLDPLKQFYFNSVIYSAGKLIPGGSPSDRRTVSFMDTLKTRASKTLITRKLYDLLITYHESVPVKEISSPSESGFSKYRGKKIRKIEVHRLSVFGTNLSDPVYFNPNKLEKLLNKTHINTNEFIIRKNLLFSEGDTITPIELSDNERILRELPFIDDARIVVIPVSDNEVDVAVFTKDIYSIGGDLRIDGLKKGNISVYDRNIFGMGHEFGIQVPYNSAYNDSPGFGVNYIANNIGKSFVNMNLYFLEGLGNRTYGFDISRKLVSSSTKYAGGISIKELFTTDNLDSMINPARVKLNLQDYWLSRSFLINPESVSRIIIGARYTNNNVFDHPFILPDSYHYLQKYKMFLGSAAWSVQKFHKANLIYGYGRTEDIPFGGLFDITVGNEINEFKHRIYLGSFLSLGKSINGIGYFYSSAGFATFLNHGITEQGMLLLRTHYISNLMYFGKYKNRNFVNIDYTRGFDRYSDESLVFKKENGFSGFSNDSIRGAQRLTVSLESVIFSPVNFYGFRFAFFGFADLGCLFGSNQYVSNGHFLSGIGLGIRIRNDNLVLNTLQVRLGFYPNLPAYSTANNLVISGQQLLYPADFEPGAPSVLTFK
jgi:hypothetical protein